MAVYSAMLNFTRRRGYRIFRIPSKNVTIFLNSLKLSERWQKVIEQNGECVDKVFVSVEKKNCLPFARKMTPVDTNLR